MLFVNTGEFVNDCPDDCAVTDFRGNAIHVFLSTSSSFFFL